VGAVLTFENTNELTFGNLFQDYGVVADEPGTDHSADTSALES